MTPSAAPATPQKPSVRVAATATPQKRPAATAAAAEAAVAFDEAEFRTWCSNRVNRRLRTLHEGVAVKAPSSERALWADRGATYGGITGTVTPTCMTRLAKVLATGRASDDGPALSSEYLLTRRSVFGDIGCGTGRPSFYFASLPIACSMGFDIDPLQVRNCVTGWTLLRNKGEAFRAPVIFDQRDASALKSVSPVTHLYAFIGYEEFTRMVVALAATSPTVKTLAVVVLRKQEMVENGAWDPQSDNDVVELGGMKMAGGKSYPGYVLPMTPARRKRILAKIGPWTGGPQTLDDVVAKAVQGGASTAAFEHSARIAAAEEAGRPKRGAAAVASDADSSKPKKRARRTVGPEA